jgi:hypothetical protein
MATDRAGVLEGVPAFCYHLTLAGDLSVASLVFPGLLRGL